MGNISGSRVMSYGNPKLSGEYDSENLIFAGKGVTICYPQADGNFKHLACSSDEHP
jgi:hypothetical protein